MPPIVFTISVCILYVVNFTFKSEAILLWILDIAIMQYWSTLAIINTNHYHRYWNTHRYKVQTNSVNTKYSKKQRQMSDTHYTHKHDNSYGNILHNVALILSQYHRYWKGCRCDTTIWVYSSKYHPYYEVMVNDLHNYNCGGYHWAIDQSQKLVIQNTNGMPLSW